MAVVCLVVLGFFACIVMTSSTSMSRFVREPMSQNWTLNTNPRFTCEVEQTHTYIVSWELTMNRLHYSDKDPPFDRYTTAMDIGNIIHNLNFSITDDFIDITGATTIDIVCAATINGSTAYTEPAQLKIQGAPPSISNVSYTFDELRESVNIAWEGSPSILLPEGLGTRYCIEIDYVNHSLSDDNITVNEERHLIITETFYTYTFPEGISPCGHFILSVQARNGPEDNVVRGGELMKTFVKYAKPPHLTAADVSLQASYNDKEQSFQASIMLEDSVQLCNNRCYAINNDDMLNITSNDGLQCSSNTIRFSALKGSHTNQLLQFYQPYHFTIYITNSAGNGAINGIVLYISEDLISARVEVTTTALLVVAIFTTSSHSEGVYSRLTKERSNKVIGEQACGSGIQSISAKKKGNMARATFRNLFIGHYNLHLVPLNGSGEIGINENGKLNALLVLEYPTTLAVYTKIGSGLQSAEISSNILLQNFELILNNYYKGRAVLFIVSEVSETNILNSTFLYYHGGSTLPVHGLIVNTEYCVGEYDKNLIGSSRKWKVLRYNQDVKMNHIVILSSIISSIIGFLILSMLIAVLLVYLKKRCQGTYQVTHGRPTPLRTRPSTSQSTPSTSSIFTTHQITPAPTPVHQSVPLQDTHSKTKDTTHTPQESPTKPQDTTHTPQYTSIKPEHTPQGTPQKPQNTLHTPQGTSSVSYKHSLPSNQHMVANHPKSQHTPTTNPSGSTNPTLQDKSKRAKKPERDFLKQDEENFNRCPDCFLRPCILSTNLQWLQGKDVASSINADKRNALYIQFNKELGQLGAWKRPEYLKKMEENKYDVRKVMPKCVIKEVQRRYPSPSGEYNDYKANVYVA